MNFVPQWEGEPKWHAKLHFLPLFEDPSIVCPIRPSGPVTSGASVVCLNNFSKIFQKRNFFQIYNWKLRRHPDIPQGPQGVKEFWEKIQK